MKADNERSLWERVRQCAAVRYLKSPKGPLVAAVAVALVAVMIYTLANLRSCESRGTISGGGSLWHTATGGSDEDLSGILSQIEGAGETDVLVTYDKSGTLVGVVVVSEGARDQAVVVKLMRAVSTATGAKVDQIEIFEKNK